MLSQLTLLYGFRKTNWKTKEAIEPYYGLNFTFNSFKALTAVALNLIGGLKVYSAELAAIVLVLSHQI